jgi:hypothetical protein
MHFMRIKLINPDFLKKDLFFYVFLAVLAGKHYNAPKNNIIIEFSVSQEVPNES